MANVGEALGIAVRANRQRNYRQHQFPGTRDAAKRHSISAITATALVNCTMTSMSQIHILTVLSSNKGSTSASFSKRKKAGGVEP